MASVWYGCGRDRDVIGILTIVTQNENFRFDPRHGKRSTGRTPFYDFLAFRHVLVTRLRDVGE